MCDHRGGGGDCRCGNYYDDDFPVLPDKPTDIDLSNPNDAIVKHVNIIADEVNYFIVLMFSAYTCIRVKRDCKKKAKSTASLKYSNVLYVVLNIASG